MTIISIKSIEEYVIKKYFCKKKDILDKHTYLDIET